MGLLSRLFTFIPGTLAKASEVNAELDQLVDALNGTGDNEIEILSSHATTPLLTLRKATGAASLLDIVRAGISRVTVQNNGQLNLNPSGGVGPINSQSNVVCTGLNADLVDGLHASQLVSNADVQAIQVSLSSSQSDNIAANNHVEFDSIDEQSGAGIALSTGPGQLDGVLTIPPGVWYITAEANVSFAASNQGNIRLSLYNATAATQIGNDAFIIPAGASSTGHTHSTMHALLVNGGSMNIEVRIVSLSNPSHVSIISSLGTTLLVVGIAN